MQDGTLRVVPLLKEHIQLLYGWFNEPHVRLFYSLKSWTLDEVAKKFMPRISGETSLCPFIVMCDETAIGYVQYYSLKNENSYRSVLPPEIFDNAAGIDLFIGEADFLGKGLGSVIVRAVLEQHVWSYYQYCVVDPDQRNTASLLMFERCGFRQHAIVSTRDDLGQVVQYVLLVKSK